MNSKLRKEFLADLPPSVKGKMRGSDLILINKAIAAILNGQTTINGKQPTTREDRFAVIVTYFKTAKTQQNISIDMPLLADLSKAVAIKMIDQPAAKKVTWKTRKRLQHPTHF